jgi:hypothetical protein
MATNLQTTIAIAGKLNASLPASVKAANLQLMSIAKTSQRVSATMAIIAWERVCWWA